MEAAQLVALKARDLTVPVTLLLPQVALLVPGYSLLCLMRTKINLWQDNRAIFNIRKEKTSNFMFMYTQKEAGVCIICYNFFSNQFALITASV